MKNQSGKSGAIGESNQASDHVLYVRLITRSTMYEKAPFHWTAILLRSWRSQNFSKIIPNCRGSVDSHKVWGLGASSTLPLRFYNVSVTLLLRPQYANEDSATLSLR